MGGFVCCKLVQFARAWSFSNSLFLKVKANWMCQEEQMGWWEENKGTKSCCKTVEYNYGYTTVCVRSKGYDKVTVLLQSPWSNLGWSDDNSWLILLKEFPVADMKLNHPFINGDIFVCYDNLERKKIWLLMSNSAIFNVILKETGRRAFWNLEGSSEQIMEAWKEEWKRGSSVQGD